MTLFPLLWKLHGLLVLIAKHTVPKNDPELKELLEWAAKRDERREVAARRPTVLGYRKCDRCKKPNRRCYAMPGGEAMCIYCRKQTKDERGWV